MAVSPTLFNASKMPIGNHPMRCMLLNGLPFSKDERSTNVNSEQIMQVVVTERIRPRITEGASRDSVGEGRVVEER